jgi:protein O-GlcNAc transferase
MNGPPPLEAAMEHHRAGRLTEAEKIYRQILAEKPDDADALHLLGTIASQTGNPQAGVELIRRAMRLAPGRADFHYNLGNALRQLGRFEEAIVSFRETNRLNPNFAPAFNNLGSALRMVGRADDAIPAFNQAIRLNTNYLEAHSNLGSAFRSLGKFDEAIAAYRRAISIDHKNAKPYSNLANVLKDIGKLDEAIAAYRHAVALEPDNPTNGSNLAYSLLFHPAYDAAAIAEENRRWNDRHARPLRKLIRDHSNDRDPNRRLRIGYVSPDFRDHVIGRNLIPLFQHHDREQVHITCYAHVPAPDAVTARFQKLADRWRNIVGLSDETVARGVRDDEIDILVDLALHLAANRLLVFARKPAPVQVTFAGYPGSTGVETIDYRLTDPHLDPPESGNHFYSEKSLPLPDTFWCYDPLGLELDVSPLPAKSNGYVTFGCLNNFCKCNNQVLQLWARVLNHVDRSRMIILCPEGSHRTRVLQSLQRESVSSDRIELVAARPREKYLELYHRIDVGLDTFPYNGHTTSLDSLWMGVPVVTLAGNTVVGRAGVSQLTNLGLTDLIAHSAEDYVRIAAELATDLPRLAELRATLRPRMQASPLMDGAKFARSIEAAYRQIWQTWCDGNAGSP